MKLKVGDLVMVDSKACVVVKIVNSKVFEGGEECSIVTILQNETKKEVMSWSLNKVNV